MRLKTTTAKLLCGCLALSLTAASVLASTDGPKRNTVATEKEAVPASEVAVSVGQSGEEKDYAYKKTETVYVNLDPSGKPYEQIVSDWLHSDTAGATLTDRSTLSDIVNVKGVEEPQRSGDELVWQLEGNDLYYRGKTNQQLPVDVEITYKLDGKKISPEKLAGKSGQVEISFAFKNNLSQKVTIGDKKVTMYTPVMAAVALSLPDDTFSNVTVTDGTVQTDGSNEMVAFVAMPGLNESLDLDAYDIPGVDAQDMDFPEQFTITAQANEFEMGPIGIIMTVGSLDLEEIDPAADIDDMRTDMNDLRDAQDELNAWDPDRKIRSLFSTPAYISGAQALVQDIYDFYDLDTAIFDLLPDYITQGNIDLYDRVSEDLDKINIDDILDSDAINGLIGQLTARNIDRIRALLEDYDTIRDLDCDELDDLIGQSIELLNAMENNQEQVQTLRALINNADGMMALLQGLESSGLADMLGGDRAKTAISALVKSQVQQEVEQKTGVSMQKLEQAEGLLASGATDIRAVQPDLLAAIASSGLPQEDQQALRAIVENFSQVADQPVSVLQGGQSSGATIGWCGKAGRQDETNDAKEDDAGNRQELRADLSWDSEAVTAKGSGEPAAAYGVTLGTCLQGEGSQAGISTYAAGGKTCRQQLTEAVILIRQGLDTTIDENAQPIIDRMMGEEIGPMMDQVKKIQENLSAELGASGKEELNRKLNEAAEFTNRMIVPLQQMMETAEELAGRLDRAPEQHQLQYLLGETRDMLDHLQENEENIRALQRVVREYDSDKFEDIRDNWPQLRRDIREVRPILQSLRDDLKDPAMDASLHAAPEMTPVLLRMKEDILNNRPVADIFWETVRPDGVGIARSMFGRFDRLQEKDAANTYSRQIDDVDELLKRKDALQELADSYRIYTAASDEADTDLKFILKTDEIEKPEPETQPIEEPEKTSFLDWLKGLVGKEE